jgi:hypothetical protein
MRIWDYDKKTIKKTPHTIRWKLERTINFGLDGKKLKKTLLKKEFPRLRIDPKKREFLRFILWNR